jgi:hypothetical protein
MKKGINSIFKKDPTGTYYNAKARLFQDILVYASTLKQDQPFKLWDLAGFLLEKNKEFRDRYKGSIKNISTRKEEISRRIERNVEKLVQLHVLKEAGKVKEERGTGLVQIYNFTPFGFFLSGIIQSLRSDEDADKKLYNVLREHIFGQAPRSTSFVIFASNFIKKLHDKGQFSIYVTIFRKLIDSNYVTDIVSFVKLLQNLVNIKFVHSLSFVFAWEETLDELEPEIKKLFLHDQKLIFDTVMGHGALTKEYEDLRYKIREDPENIVIEGFCSGCNKMGVIEMNITQYYRRVAYADDVERKGLLYACPNCNARPRTLQLPNLLERADSLLFL